MSNSVNNASRASVCFVPLGWESCRTARVAQGFRVGEAMTSCRENQASLIALRSTFAIFG